MSTIMIVEDAPIIRQPIEAALKRAGYETIVAEHGEEALARLGERTPDLILLDLAMPVMDGLTFLRAIRSESEWKHLPVIVLTAIAEKPRVMQAVKLGISSYLLKSRFSLDEMLELIGQHIGQNPSDTMPVQGDDADTNATTDADAPIKPRTDEGTGMEIASSAEAQSSPPKPVAAAADAPTSAAGCSAEMPPLSPGADPLEALKQIKPLMTRSEVSERIEGAGELKGLSPAVMQVLKLTGSDRCSIEQVAKAISQDHAIALKVLKLANSAVYTRGEAVDSVQLAVSRIGLGEIRQTVLNLSVIDQFNSSKQVGGISFGQFWEHAIAVGLISSALTRARHEKDVDTAFTMGLLHDVGRLIFADHLGETYAEVVRVAETLKLPLELVESRLLIYNHADVMDRLLHSWKFPKQLINPIVYHHLSGGNIRRNAPKQMEEVATLGLANRLAHAMMLGTSGNETIYPTEELCSMLKLAPDIVRAIHATTREETDKIKFALLATSDTPNWEQLREVHRRALQRPFHAIFVSANPDVDAYRIFCEEMTADFHEPPNVGVLHFTNVRERVPLTGEYRKRELAEGASNLPLLVLSPAGKIIPENSLVNGRPCEVLSTPCTISRFIEAFNRLSGQVSQNRAA